jgi:hypothetical protein
METEHTKFPGQDRSTSSGALVLKQLSPHDGYLHCNWSLIHVKFDARVQISYTTVKILQNTTEFITFALHPVSFFSLHTFPSHSDLFLPTYCRCKGLLLYLMAPSDTQHTRQDSSGWGIGPPQRPLPDNKQHPQQIDIYALGGVRTRNPKKRAAADPRLRLRSHRDFSFITNSVFFFICHTLIFWSPQKYVLIEEFLEH